jgi:hypothetical protein
VEGGIAEGGIAGCGISLQYHPLLWCAGFQLPYDRRHELMTSVLSWNIILYANFFDNSAISLVNVDVVFFSNFS